MYKRQVQGLLAQALVHQGRPAHEIKPGRIAKGHPELDEKIVNTEPVNGRAHDRRENTTSSTIAWVLRPKALVTSAGTFYVPARPTGASKAPAERTKAFGLAAHVPYLTAVASAVMVSTGVAVSAGVPVGVAHSSTVAVASSMPFDTAVAQGVAVTAGVPVCVGALVGVAVAPHGSTVAVASRSF